MQRCFESQIITTEIECERKGQLSNINYNPHTHTAIIIDERPMRVRVDDHLFFVIMIGQTNGGFLCRGWSSSGSVLSITQTYANHIHRIELQQYHTATESLQ